nr:MAG TPA: hypothetical protein [Caudoviricetes sp.]
MWLSSRVWRRCVVPCSGCKPAGCALWVLFRGALDR